MNNLIPLQTAFATQNRGDTWEIFSEDNELLATLPDTYSPKKVMSYIHFARPFELEALNIGINFGKQETNRFFQAILANKEGEIQALQEANERLARQLEKFIINGV